VNRLAHVAPPDLIFDADLAFAFITHPRPPKDLQRAQQALRSALDPRATSEQRGDLLLKAIDEIRARPSGQLDDLAVAVTAYIAHTSRRLEVLAGIAREAPLRVDTDEASTSRSRLACRTLSLESASHIVRLAVVSALDLLISENASREPAFAAWPASTREAAQQLFELAYRVARVGTAHSIQAPAMLVEDLKGPGRVLWDKVVDVPNRETEHRFAKLLLAVESTVVGKGDATGSPPAVPCDGFAAPEGGALVVCRQPIAPSSDKQDREEIQRHQVLREPLPVVALPVRVDLERIRGTLLAEFPWAESAIDVVLGEAIGMKSLGVRDLVIPPTLFVGPPGAGKTRLARRLAELLELPCLDICVGGVGDHKALAGTSRGWATGRPGDVVSFLALRRSASALVVLDELDKAGAEARQGDLYAYLLGLLEPETASRHHDSFLKTTCDLSRVSWVCTANGVSALPAALRSRLRVLLVPQPKREHHEVIARGVIRDLERRWQLPCGALPTLEEIGLVPTASLSTRQVRIAVEAAVQDWSARQARH
jgi:hypothetical protein